MAGISSIARLQKEVQDRINSWFESGYTVDEVTAFLNEMGHDISRSAVGRRRKAWGEVVREVREAREAAEFLSRSFRDSPDSEVANANIEMLHTIMQHFLRDMMDDEERSLKPSEFAQMATAVQRLASSRRDEVRTTITAEEAAQEKKFSDVESNLIKIEFIEPLDKEDKPEEELEEKEAGNGHQ